MKNTFKWKGPRLVRFQGVTDRILRKVALKEGACRGAFYQKQQRSLDVFQGRLMERYLPALRQKVQHCRTLRSQCHTPPRSTGEARRLQEIRQLEEQIQQTLDQLDATMERAYAQANLAMASYSKAAFFGILSPAAIPAFRWDSSRLLDLLDAEKGAKFQ